MQNNAMANINRENQPHSAMLRDQLHIDRKKYDPPATINSILIQSHIKIIIILSLFIIELISTNILIAYNNMFIFPSNIDSF